ncbi:MAG: FAD:protein FMN transferase [Myxococcota bacterium]
MRASLLLSLLFWGCAAAPARAPDRPLPGALDAYFDRPRTLLVFMTGWCESCERQYPELERWALEHLSAVHTVAVVSGTSQESLEKMPVYQRKKLDIVFDEDGAIADRFGVSATPTLVLMTAARVERSRYRSVQELSTSTGAVALETLRDTGTELGTTYEAVLLADPEDRARAQQDLAAARILVKRYDAQLSEWRADSEISKLNRTAAERVVPLSPELRQILRGSIYVAGVTGGAFDISWRPIGELWDRAGARGTAPEEEEIEEALRGVGADKLVLDERGIYFRNAAVKLGIGSSAKGWIVDRVFELLDRGHYPQVTVKIGGDLRTRGKDAQGKASVFRLVDPYAPGQTIATLEVEGVAIATSGNYLRGRSVGDTFVGHIFDPRTGRPPRFDGSVTVLTHDAAMATALSTGLFVLGPDDGLALAKTLPGVEVVYATKQGLRSTLAVGGGLHP